MNRAVSHIRGNSLIRKITIAQLLFVIIITFVIFLLAYRKMSRLLQSLLLIGIIIVIGFGLVKSLNPMMALVKVLKGFVGLEGNLDIRLIALFIISFLAIVGTKTMCGWACSYAAL